MPRSVPPKMLRLNRKLFDRERIWRISNSFRVRDAKLSTDRRGIDLAYPRTSVALGDTGGTRDSVTVTKARTPPRRAYHSPLYGGTASGR